MRMHAFIYLHLVESGGSRTALKEMGYDLLQWSVLNAEVFLAVWINWWTYHWILRY